MGTEVISTHMTTSPQKGASSAAWMTQLAVTPSLPPVLGSGNLLSPSTSSQEALK